MGCIFAVLLTVELVRRNVQHFKYVGRIVQKRYEKWRELISTEYFSQKKKKFKPKSFQKKTDGLKKSSSTANRTNCISLTALHRPLVIAPATRFNIQKFCVLPTHCIYVFYKALRKTKAIFLPIQH